MADGILMLNDDCFLQMFKYLSLFDLANLKKTYSSLAVVADMEFRRKTRGSLSLDFDDEEHLDEMFLITKQFGSSVGHLAISYHSFGEPQWSEIFTVICEHYTERLKSLSLSGEALGIIKEDDILLIADILKNIETIEIDTYAFDSLNHFFTILSICYNARSIILDFEIDIEIPKTIFQKNKNLVSLKLFTYIKDSDLKQIVENLMNTRLEELFLMIMSPNSIGGNLSEVLQLNYLKRLSVECCYWDFNPFLRNVNPFSSLNLLSIRFATLDQESIDILGRISPLKVLQLMECSSHLESLLVLCGNKNFEHLRFLCDIMDFGAIGKVKFMKIIESRKAAGNCLHLTLWYKFHIASLNAIPSEFFEANYDTIKLIDRHNRKYEYCDLE